MQKKIISFLLIVTVFACNVNKNKRLEFCSESTELIVEKAFIQEEIPGTQGEESKFYATIEIQTIADTEIILDSIVYISSTFSQVRMKASTSIKFELTERDCSLELEEGVKDRATIYFKKGKQIYRQVINAFLIKEPIYLP